MIPLIKSTFYREAQTKKALNRFITSATILSFNQYGQQFEKSFSKYQGRKYSTFVNSGSSANLAIIQALLNLGRLKSGDKVGFSALTWSTNVMPLIQLGLQPIPIDVELDTLNISSQTVLEVLKKTKISVLFITHLLGLCSDLDEIVKLCKKEKIILIEDTCEALGSVFQKKRLGNFGLASTFSFYVGHHLSTIEGGMVCTDDEELSVMLRIVRAHGWDRNLTVAEQRKVQTQFKRNPSFYSRYTFYDLGYNLRPTEIAGFLGNYQLGFIEKIVSKRQTNFAYLAPKLYQANHLYYPVVSQQMDVFSNFAVPLICRSVELRDTLVKKCADKVEIRPIVGGDMTQQPFFLKHTTAVSQRFKTTNAHLIHQQGLYFGNNPELTRTELKTLITTFVF
jgi:CDP-4-dehydro-6-deoxyglucose reductase, E1